MAERLVHLATLLDALLLYDELYVLDAQLPHDADTLPLRQVLLDRRILRPVGTRALSASVADELTGFLRDAETFQESWSPRGLASGEDVANSVRLLLAHPDESGGPTNPRGRGIASVMRGEVEGDLSAGRIWSSRPELQSDPLRTLGWTMLTNIGYFHSGAIYGGVSHLRTFVYWRVSAHLRIPFLPSLHRLPAYHLITDHVRRTVQDRVYEVVADSFRTTVAEVYEDENPAPLYLPPALALFLNHLRAHGDIAMAVDDLRHQHRKLRRVLAELQQSLSPARPWATPRPPVIDSTRLWTPCAATSTRTTRPRPARWTSSSTSCPAWSTRPPIRSTWAATPRRWSPARPSGSAPGGCDALFGPPSD
ncbi:hypothetical protein STANM337S_00443 [Streptomyces tanashiensis]